MKTVAVIELNLLERMVPLLGGYLEAYATTDPWLKSTYRFQKHVCSPHTDRAALLQRVLGFEADIYAFSCYVWNMGLISWLLGELRKARPAARIMLGGPQVMHRAQRYLTPECEGMAICNGEGEITFSDYLREMTEPTPDLSKVGGISFVADGKIVTTSARQRTTELDEIPSPFLKGLFHDDYAVTVLETNRGCPFHCGFCYWGAATNDRVFKFSEDRVRDELTWISKKGILYLFIADANWGMLNRDVELTRHLAECTRNNGTPKQLYFSSAKNSPDRVFEIVKMCQSADMLVAQPVSLQTLSDNALQMIQRQNIKHSSYLKLQLQLDELKIRSVTELIWPLPGETLESFKTGVDEVCRSGNSTVLVYPHLLLPNTPLDKRRTEFKLDTIPSLDGIGEAELVVGTNMVSREEFEEGFRYYYAVHLLHNAYGLRSVLEFVDRNGIATYKEVFTDFAEFTRTTDCPVFDYITESCKGQIGLEFVPNGKIVHYALYEHRQQFIEALHQFISSRSYWSDERVRFLYELDRLRLPYIYRSAAVPVSQSEFLTDVSCHNSAYDFTVPERFTELFHWGAPDGLKLSEARAYRHRIDHAQAQYPYMKTQGINHNAAYCQEVIRNGGALPTCRVLN